MLLLLLLLGSVHPGLTPSSIAALVQRTLPVLVLYQIIFAFKLDVKST